MELQNLRGNLEIAYPNGCCLSGGALGGDTLFGMYSTENALDQLHFSFKGHRTGKNAIYALELTDDELKNNTVQALLKKANITLCRSVPNTTLHVYKLLARNSFQVYATDSVYAIAPLHSPSTVTGGTAWAVQMYIDICKERSVPVKVYVYNPLDKKAYTFNNEKHVFEVCTSVPKPQGYWTGIGSRTAEERDLRAFEKFFV